jgi:hypothetical protein
VIDDIYKAKFRLLRHAGVRSDDQTHSQTARVSLDESGTGSIQSSPAAARKSTPSDRNFL